MDHLGQHGSRDGWKGCGEVFEETCHAAELVAREAEQATYGEIRTPHSPKSRELDAQKVATLRHGMPGWRGRGLRNHPRADQAREPANS